MQIPTLDYVEKKIEVLNKLHELAAEYYRETAAIFRPFIGCKIILADGRYIKEIRDKLSELDLSWEHQARSIGWHNQLHASRFVVFSYSGLSLINAFYDGSRENVEISSYLADLDGNTLKDLKEWEDRPTYDVGQTMADLERLARLKSEADELESHYRPVFRR
jgi:hypothetical protein